jgi:hypothetical protein
MRHDNHRKKAMPGEWVCRSSDGGRPLDTMRDYYYNDGNRTEGNGQLDPDVLTPARELDPFRVCGVAPFKRAHHGS